MFVLQKVHNQFKVRGGRAIKMAAALCAAGVVAGVAGGVVLAQLTGRNPASQSEVTEYGPCTNLVPCVDPASLACATLPSSITLGVPGGTANSGGYAALDGPGASNCGSEPAPWPWGELGFRVGCGPPPIAASCANGSP